tara:strand:+ start:64 stop:522 length:459 start_codon:yes stop_codon:yes gene_type:complete
MAVIKPKRSGTASSVPTTSDLADGEFAINTADQKIYIRSGTNIVEVGNVSGGSVTEAFKNIAVSGQSNIVADSATDTLTVSGTGLVSVTTTAGTDTIDIGTASAAQISFTKADGTSSDIDLQTSGKINQVITNLHIPFTKADGTSVTTLVVS